MHTWLIIAGIFGVYVLVLVLVLGLCRAAASGSTIPAEE